MRRRLATNPTSNAHPPSVQGSIAPPPEEDEEPEPLLVELPPALLVDEPPPVSAVVAGVTVAWAEPIFVESTADTAVIVTVAGVGTVIGAVYTPDAEIIPSAALPPAVPLTLQLTAMLEVPVTVAANV